MRTELRISSKLLQSFSAEYRGAHVLVTGGTSFLGKRVVAALEQAGCRVTAVGSKQVDLRDRQQTRDLFSQKHDLVIHGAAVQGGLEFILAHPTEIFLENQLIHTNVIEACQRFPPRKLIGIGSSCSYPGNRSDLREDEFWQGRLEESVFSYGFTKKTLFVGQYSLHKEVGISGAHLVLNNLYGIGDNFDASHSHVVAALISKFADAAASGEAVKIWGDGSAERELLYVDDAVEGVLRALLRINGFELLNIANGKPVAIRELVAVIAKAFDYHRIEFDASKPSGALRKSLSPERCASLLGWVPSTSLEEGISATLSWYRANHPSAK